MVKAQGMISPMKISCLGYRKGPIHPLLQRKDDLEAVAAVLYLLMT